MKICEFCYNFCRNDSNEEKEFKIEFKKVFIPKKNISDIDLYELEELEDEFYQYVDKIKKQNKAKNNKFKI